MSKRLLTTFDLLYQEKVGARYPLDPGKDGRLLKHLRTIYSDEEIEAFMRGFFAIQDDWIEENGYSIGVFKATLPRVIQWVKQGQPARYDKATAGIARWLENHKRRQSGN